MPDANITIDERESNICEILTKQSEETLSARDSNVTIKERKQKSARYKRYHQREITKYARDLRK